MLTNKPYFTLRLEMSSCSYTVMLNGAAIEQDLRDQPLSIEMPINHWLRTGENGISINLYPPEEDQPISSACDCTLTLQVRPSGTDSRQNKVISILHYSGELAQKGIGTGKSTSAGKYSSVDGFIKKPDGDVIVSNVKIAPAPEDYGQTFTQTVTLTTPFPEWAFFSSDALPDLYAMSDQEYDHYHAEVYKQYEHIQNALKRKDIDSILPLFEERSRETDIAYYHEKGRTIKKLEESLKAAVSNPNYELAELKRSFLMIDFGFVNRKMERLKRRNGTAIGFGFTHTTGSENYDLIFRRQNGKWIITR
ncbi:MAG: hypothetical protein GXP08_12275 [Gammaproteobacteria bacterium]|nr:hypothetical protein [Gammaproteobacteria bacterium]